MITHNESSPVLPSKVVVLGASGFVGNDLIGHLAQLGIPTVPLSSKEVDLSKPESSDMLQQLVAKSDALVFLSAIAPDKGRDVATLMKNLAMGENVARFLGNSPCSQVIYVSSDAVYEDAANPVREASCASPSSLHGVMHLVRERMLSHVLKDSGIPFLILRPTLLYGTGDTHNGYGPNRYLRTAQKDRKITLFGEGEEKRDHVYVKDVSRLIGLCLLHRSEGVLNVATGTSLSFLKVAQTVAGLCEAEIEIECLPRAMPVTHRHFDVADTMRAFPSFKFIPFEAGLGETFENSQHVASGG